MKRSVDEIRFNLDRVGCDNETAAEMCDEIERLRAALAKANATIERVAAVTYTQEAETERAMEELRAENARLRDFVHECDGMTLCTQNTDGSFTDEGVVVAADILSGV